MPRNIKTSFNAGEFSERLYGRVDLEKYASGSKTMRNFVPMPHGGATRRPGTKFIEETKDSSKLSRLIPFQFSTEQAYIIEAGDQYMRFYMNGGQILTADAYTLLLLHYEGKDASKTIEDSGVTGHTITCQNNAQIDDEQSKFTGSSLLLGSNGQSDYLSITDHSDFNWGTGEVTFDTWVRFPTPIFPYTDPHGGIHCIYYQGDTTETDHIALFYCFETKRFYFLVMDGGTSVASRVLGSDIMSALNYDQWYHIALVRGWGGVADRWAIVLNGFAAFTFDEAITIPDHDGNPRIGEAADTKIFDFGNTQHPITRNGTTISTGSTKLGRGSLLFNGSSNYLSVADHDDFNILTQTNFTIDLWVQHVDHAGNEAYFSHYEGSGESWSFYHQHGSGLRFQCVSGGSMIVETPWGGEITDSNWHHIAVCKVGNEYGVYKDGVQVSYLSDSSTDTFDAPLYIGMHPGAYFDGYMKNVRIDHANVYGAAPNSGLTNTISVPTKNPLRDVTTKLLIFGEPKRFNGWLDETRLSNDARWTTWFTPPSVPYPAGDGSGTAYEIVTT